MEVFKIEGTQDIPEVILDQEAGRLEFSGKSLPEDVEEVYNPIIEWIDNYIDSPQQSTHVIFRFEYFNTASSKKILDLLEKIKYLNDNNYELHIDWYYFDNDEDMLEAGESFSEFIDVSFNFVNY